jgi:uncharacterized membrane protein
MDLYLDLAHALAAIVWLAGGAVLALILLAARTPDTARRAAAEAELIGRRVLAPASAMTLVTGLLLAMPAGLGGEAWVVLGSLFVVGSLAARTVLLAPAFADATSKGSRAATGRALGLALLDLGAQGATLALMFLRPGWTEAAILAGLVACLLLAVALLRSLGESLVLPS